MLEDSSRSGWVAPWFFAELHEAGALQDTTAHSAHDKNSIYMYQNFQTLKVEVRKTENVRETDQKLSYGLQNQEQVNCLFEEISKRKQTTQRFKNGPYQLNIERIQEKRPRCLFT